MMASEIANKCNLIINYLPQTLTDQEFHDLFESVGKTTSTRIIRDKASNYSFGYGFVNYEKEEDAGKAIAQLNGQTLQHKTIKVAYSQPSGVQTKNINLHVSGLPEYTTDEMLRSYFESYGTLQQCRTVKNKDNGECQGFGFVLFSNRDEALNAMKGINGTVVPGTEDKIFSIKFAKTEQKGPPPSYLKKTPGVQSTKFDEMGVYGGGGSNAARGRGNGVASRRGRGGGPMRGHSFRGRYSPMTANNSGFASAYGYNNYNAYNASNYATDGNFYGGGDFQYQGGTGSETIVFVYGIGPHTDEDTLWNLFSPFGTIMRVNVIYNQAKGQGKGYGFVTFSSYSEASYAIHNLNGTKFHGKELQVSIKTDGQQA